MCDDPFSVPDRACGSPSTRSFFMKGHPSICLSRWRAVDSKRIAAVVDYRSEYMQFLVVALLPGDAQALDDYPTSPTFNLVGVPPFSRLTKVLMLL